MDKIKKSIEEIPLPNNLHRLARESLNKSTKKKARQWILPTVAILFLTLCTSTLVFSNYISIPDFFESKEQKLAMIDETKIVVESDMFMISLKDFIDYKENTRLIHELNNFPNTLTDIDLINRLIENELLLYEANKRGITATTQEIEEYALFTKEAWSTTEDSKLNELFEEMAKTKNISVEDYFTHPDILKQYEKTVITNNLAMKLYTEGILTDHYNIEQYKVDLRNKYLDKIQINKSALE